MPETRNLCAQLPLALHAQVCEAREAAGLTTAQYITQLLTEYYEMKENGGSVKDTRIRGAPEKGTKSQPRKAGNFRGKPPNAKSC